MMVIMMVMTTMMKMMTHHTPVGCGGAKRLDRERNVQVGVLPCSLIATL